MGELVDLDRGRFSATRNGRPDICINDSSEGNECIQRPALGKIGGKIGLVDNVTKQNNTT
jgi:hypothetical protein